MDIAEIRYRHARQLAVKEESLAAFARKINKSHQRVMAIAGVQFRKAIGSNTAREIERAYNLPLGYMDQALPEWSDGSTISVARRRYGEVPVLSWFQAAEFCVNKESFNENNVEKWMQCPTGHGRYTFCLKVNGDSMTSNIPGETSFPHGTYIYVDPDRQLENLRGVIAKTPSGDYTFKIYTEDAGKKYLQPINKQYPMIDITDAVHICGVVIGLFIDI